MKRFLLFFLSSVLTVAFLMPATVQAKKIKCGQFLYYEGEVEEKVPHGKGALKVKPPKTNYLLFSLEGMFSMDGSVTDAEVSFNSTINGMRFEGKLSYTAVNDILTLHLQEGKFIYNTEKKNQVRSLYSAVQYEEHSLDIPAGNDILLTIVCNENGGFIKNPKPFEIKKTFYVSQTISSMVGGLETVKGKTTYQIVSLINPNIPHPDVSKLDYLMAPYTIVSKGSTWDKQKLADGTIVEPQKVVFPNGDFYDATFNTFSKTFPDGTISTDKKNYEYDANVAGYTKHTIGGQQKIVIKNSDGSVYTGSLTKIKPEEPINEIDSEFIKNVIYKVKSIAELMSTYKYWFGTLAKSKGNTTVYWGGKSKEKVIAEDKKAKEDYINYWKNEGKKAEALYNELCKKFGKKYVDAAGSGRIAIGTPEGLLDYMRGVHHHHTQADVYIKEHATHTVGQPWAYDWIYITNGKVSYITTKYSYDEHAW